MDENDKKILATSYVNLKEHFEMIFSEREKQVELRFEALSDALKLAASGLQDRVEELNSLRREYTTDRTKDQENFVKSNVYYPKMKDVDDWISTVNKQLTIINTRSITWAAAVGVFFTIIMILLRFWK